MEEVRAQITNRRFTAGITLVDGRVTETAPILRFMKGHTLDWVREYCSRRHGWHLALLSKPAWRGDRR
ncbi:hypothetical protein ACVMGC_001042 [Bradyrhizobium barranii subsp. barranii]|uniref:hypothetical protein n=1 Tax=Bradyrhizobium TaxID=374 RepID=UPI001BA8617F|nr:MULTISPECIES: hypothetical protein [Bradyrhizobium]MBR0879641.1 hypothetical protein [Bradyrhizobium liaoningense]MCP1778805.1 hypothetical protein [Bradyrhizobium japonicum]MCP1958197.1 hypothetical protein [Bradyrhizobium japonicum]